MSEWTKTKLKDLFTVRSSKRVLQADWRSDGVPFYRGREITTLARLGRVDNDLFISEEHFKQLSERHGVPKAGDIMVTAIGTIGNSYVVREADRFYFKDASVLWLEKKADVDSKFVNFWISSDAFRSQLSTGNGATVDTLTITALSDISISVPPLDEQQRLVALIEGAHERSASLTEDAERAALLIKQLARERSETMVVKSGADRIGLGDLCEVLDSKRKPITKADRTSGPFPYYGATGAVDFVDGYIFDEPLVLLGEDGAKWGAGDRSAFAISGKTWVNNHAHVLRPDRTKVRDEWLISYLNAADLGDYITGATVPKLNQAKMREVSVPVPSLEEQDEVLASLRDITTRVQELSVVFDEKARLGRELTRSVTASAMHGAL